MHNTNGEGCGEVPWGFKDQSDFEEFGAKLKSGLAEAGFRDTQVAFQGSSVTGVKYTTGAAFDVGRVSDYDIALAGEDIFDKAQDAGIGLRSGSTPSSTARPPIPRSAMSS